jgi:flagellar motor switch protein FliG
MAMVSAVSSVSGVRKAAILLVTLGADVSAAIMKRLSEDEIESLTVEISKIRDLSTEAVGGILEEFSQLAQARSFIMQGGFSYARDLLNKAFGSDRAGELLGKLQLVFQEQPFAALRKADPKQLSDFIRREHPQTIALILANVDADIAALVLAHLNPEARLDVVQRLATMEVTSPDVIKQVDQVLERRLSSLLGQEVSMVGGTKAVAEILNRIDRSTEKQIFEALEPANPKLADEIRRLMFTFDDVVRLDDRSIQRLLKEVEQKDLALALKAAAEPVTTKIFSNLSERAQGMLKQEIEYLGPVRLRDVEEAQAGIVRIIRTLEESGEIVVASGADDVLV